ncbi:MAG: YidC/Oxa1 family membrane protein insertase [Armatimonadota bacterium]
MNAIFVLAACVGPVLAADGITFQRGLPSDLVIDMDRPLDDQVDELEELIEWGVENQPSGGGFLDSIASSFTDSDEPATVPVYQITDDLAAFQNQKVHVNGLFTRVSDEEGYIVSFGRRLDLDIGGGAQIEGFGDVPLEAVPATITGLVEAVGEKPQPGMHVTGIQPSLWLSSMRMGRIMQMTGEFEDAVTAFADGAEQAKASKSILAGHAIVRAAQIAYSQLEDEKLATKYYEQAWNNYASLATNGECLWIAWVPDAETQSWHREPLRQFIGPTMDELNQGSFWYKVVDVFIKIGFGNPGIGVILMAVVVRLMIWPLTRKQLESAKEMQRLQPQIKALQDKHVDDKQKFQEEFWKLCQQHGVNPLGGCLPMLLQLPVLIMLYRGIQAYIWHFDHASFLWVENLAAPDMILLVGYTISMIFFQKMTQKLNPAASMNPEQAQQQKMMTYMMPIVFFFIFQSFPAAFILYWLGSNLIYFGAQAWYNATSLDATTEEEEPPEKPEKTRAGTFVDTMVNMMNMGPNPDDETADAGEQQTYAEAKAAEKGKRIGKESDKKD